MSAEARGVPAAVAWFRENLAFRPEDRRPAFLIVILHAIVGSALVIAYSARDALFLSSLAAKPEKLALADLLAAVLSGFAAAGVAHLRRRLAVELLFPVLATVAGSLLFALGLLAWKKPDADVAPRLIFMLMDAIAAAILVPLWALTESSFSSRDTKRVIALVDVGRLIVVLLAGLWTWGMVHVIHPRWLLAVAAGLLWVSSVPVILLGLGRALRGAPVRLPGQTGDEVAARLRAATLPHVSVLAAVMTLGVLVATLVDFELKMAIATAFPGDATAIARFVSGYASFSGALALALTIGAAPFLYQRYGIGGVLVGCAVATAAGMGGVALALLSTLVPILGATACAKATHELFRFSGADSMLPQFLAPLPRQLREDASGFIRSYVLPFSAVAAALLIVGTHQWRLAVPTATVVFATLLVVALHRFRVEFSRSRQYRTSGASVGKDGFSFVPAALQSSDPRDIETALELAPRVRGDLTPAVARLLGLESPRIRKLALDYIASRSGAEGTAATADPALEDRVREALADPTSDVRASAIRAFCVMKKAGALGDILGFLNAPEANVRAAAAAALFFHGGSTGQAAGARPLKRLLGSQHAVERESLADALAAVALPACTQLVLTLIEDDDPRVRRAAVKAAGRIRSEDLLSVIVDALPKNETARVARDALAGYGEEVLGRLLREHAASRAVVVEIARILGRLATPPAIEILMDHLDDSEETMRGAVLGALARAASQDASVKLDRGRLEGALIVDAVSAYRALAMSDAFLAADPKSDRKRDRAGALIGWACGEKYERALGRMLRASQALHPHAVISRASAAEVLPNVLSGPSRDAVLPLFDSSPLPEKLAAATGILRPPQQSVEAWVRELLTDGDRWVVCAAAHYAGVRKLGGVEEQLVSLLDRTDGVIRETALQALERLLPIHRLPTAVQRVLWDEDGNIQRSVDRLLERIVDKVEFDRAEGRAQEAFK